MDFITKIASSQNPAIKKLKLLLVKSRERKKQSCFVIEGERELLRAMEKGYLLESVFVKEKYLKDFQLKTKAPFFELNEALFNSISIRSGSEKIIAIVKSKTHRLDQLKLNKKSLVLVVEAPEKPGNIGALLRTASAAGMDAVIISNPRTDLYHPTVVRNSLGGVFALSIALDSSENVINYLKEKSLNIMAAALSEKAQDYKKVSYTRPTALVFGTEDMGLSSIWLDQADVIVKIPVKPPIDSLNLSVSAGILMYHVIGD